MNEPSLTSLPRLRSTAPECPYQTGLDCCAVRSAALGMPFSVVTVEGVKIEPMAVYPSINWRGVKRQAILII
jgi:hypothetical protein